jgi:hypothetical protein
MQNIKIFFYLIFAAIFTIVGGIILLIKNFFVNHYKEMVFSIIMLSALVPLIYSLQSNWEIPDILVLYIMFTLFGGVMILIGQAGKDEFYDYRQEGKNYGSGYSKPNTVYTNTWYSPESIEKRKNGGITDKEVLERKKLIRRKLEKKKLLETKEEVDIK